MPRTSWPICNPAIKRAPGERFGAWWERGRMRVGRRVEGGMRAAGPDAAQDGAAREWQHSSSHCVLPRG